MPAREIYNKLTGGRGRGRERRPVDEISEQNEVKKQGTMRKTEQRDYVSDGISPLLFNVNAAKQ